MIARLILATNSLKIAGEIQKSLLEFGIPNPHPDLLYIDSSQKLGIEQARKIKEFFSLKPHSFKGKAVVLEDASKLTEEAQNSLLKTLEEMPGQSLFILAARSEADLLPTVLSRCQIIKVEADSQNQAATPGVEIEKLMQLDVAGRFEYIEKLKDRPQLLHELVAFFRNKMLENPQKNEFLKELLQAEEWAAQNVNIRAILEHLMLVIPARK